MKDLCDRFHDSVMNLDLRKKSVMDFALFYEGNLYNNMFHKIDQLYMEDCTDGPGDYCNFHKFMLDYGRDIVYEDWFEEVKCHMNVDNEWKYDDDEGWIQVLGDKDFIKMDEMRGKI